MTLKCCRKMVAVPPGYMKGTKWTNNSKVISTFLPGTAKSFSSNCWPKRAAAAAAATAAAAAAAVAAVAAVAAAVAVVEKPPPVRLLKSPKSFQN